MFEFKNLFNQIQNGNYQPISDDVWGSLEIDGFPEEVNDFDLKHYEMLDLEIPIDDEIGLAEFNDNVVNKYNNFDIELKNSGWLEKGYLDLIDYEAGKIFIIKHNKSLDETVDLSSFKIQDTKEPKLWINDKLNPKASKVLKQIANDFYDSLNIKLPIENIKIVGSIANYNWSKYSDIDLHIVLDFEKLYKTLDPKGYYEEEQFLRNYFDSKKKMWGDSHNIKIFGYDVEVYVEDLNNPPNSEAMYSLMNDEWIKNPSKENVKIDEDEISKKAESIMQQIDYLKDKTNIQKSVEKIKDKIKKMRKASLIEGGEYSVGNLVFKVLRRGGYLDKLTDLDNKDYDKQHSLKEINEAYLGGQHAPLYHFTAIDNIGGILRNDILNGHTTQEFTISGQETSKFLPGVSLTRNKNFDCVILGREMHECIGIILNNEKLRNNHKIIPYDWDYRQNKIEPTIAFGKGDPRRYSERQGIYEQEEFLVGDIKNLHKYILGLILDPNKFTDEEYLITLNLISEYRYKFPLSNIKLYYKSGKEFDLNDEIERIEQYLIDMNKDIMLKESTYSKIYQAKLKDGKVVKKSTNRDFNAVYVDVYDNGEHSIKSWSYNNGKLNEYKKEAKRYNEKRISYLSKAFPKLKFSRIVDTYIVKPKLIKK